MSAYCRKNSIDNRWYYYIDYTVVLYRQIDVYFEVSLKIKMPGTVWEGYLKYVQKTIRTKYCDTRKCKRTVGNFDKNSNNSF